MTTPWKLNILQIQGGGGLELHSRPPHLCVHHKFQTNLQRSKTEMMNVFFTVHLKKSNNRKRNFLHDLSIGKIPDRALLCCVGYPLPLISIFTVSTFNMRINS